MALSVIEWRGRSSAAFEPPDTRLTDPGDAGVVTGLPTVSTPLIGRGGYLFLNHDGSHSDRRIHRVGSAKGREAG
jgi:hypothetical protein